VSATANPVFTVGHSTHSWDGLLALVSLHGVTAVADVRSTPRSRFNPQFDRESLADSLRQRGIAYVFLGRELGGRPEDQSCYENGRVRYDLVARTALFQKGIDRVLHGAEEHRVVLLCAEKEPLECHRTLLVAAALVARGVVVQHIHADGRLERHEAAMDRLLDLVGLPRQDLLHTKEELVAEALERQEQRVAYVRVEPAADATGGTA